MVDDAYVQYALNEAEAALLAARGQHFAAGFMLGADVSPVMRHANAIARYLRHCELPPYRGESLYPVNADLWQQPTPQIIWHHYVALDIPVRWSGVGDLLAAETDEAARRVYEKAKNFFGAYPSGAYPRGDGWTHSILNYARLLAEGIDAYAARVDAHLARATDPAKRELYQALQMVLDAIAGYCARVTDYLGALAFDDPQAEANRRRLHALYADRLPLRPARGFFEAMVAVSFCFALDGCDDPGRFDQYMWPYYRADADAGRITRDEARALINTLWRTVDAMNGWNVALAGSTPDGAEASNELTILCLEAVRAMRRPNMALRLREDTPEPVWDAALDTILTGNGLPALYSEENYLRAIDMAQLNLPDEAKFDYAFGGCTELMVQGCSNVGSLDGDFSAIKTLEESLYRHLPHCTTFAEFYAAFTEDVRRGIDRLTRDISDNQQVRGQYHPQLIRTLFVDDCLDRGRHFYDGGARWNWSIVNIVGLSNTIDSLTALRKAVFEERVATPEQLLAALQADFAGFASLRQYLQGCPRFGNDDEAVNALAAHLSGMIYREFKRYASWRGGKFLCGTLMFVTYGWFGQPVGATPDGRLAGTPVADSAGPVQGRDTQGPTAMLRATASLQQIDAPGTLVVNLRLAQDFFKAPDGRAKVKSLIRTYFKLGGLQLQINVIDQAVLRDAIAHPERHGDLIVRVGGYSEYFNNLEMPIKQSMLERTEHR